MRNTIIIFYSIVGIEISCFFSRCLISYTFMKCNFSIMNIRMSLEKCFLRMVKTKTEFNGREERKKGSVKRTITPLKYCSLVR